MNEILIFLLSVSLGGCATNKMLVYDGGKVKMNELRTLPLDEENWEIASTGEGRILFLADGLLLEPKTPRFTKETYGAWVIAKNLVQNPVVDYVVRLEFTVHRQLRSQPNDWEVFWFFGNYRSDPQLIKETNYFIVKPETGAELGRAFENVGQEFLKTTAQPQLVLGKKTELIYVKQGRTFEVFQDGKRVFGFLESPATKRLYHHPGTFGLYSEDALVTIHSFSYDVL